MDPPPSPQSIPRPEVDALPLINQAPKEVLASNQKNSHHTLDLSSDDSEIIFETNPINSTNIVTQTLTPDDTTSNQIIMQDTSTSQILQNKYARLYHNDKSYMVLEQYCLPISSARGTLCKYPLRNCVVRRSKVLESGTKLNHISPTVYKPDPNLNTKLNYPQIDHRYVKCFMRNCSNSHMNKTFHFSCHIHNVHNKDRGTYELVEFKGVGDVLLDQVNDKEIKERITNFPKMNTKLIFPLCSKRCYNILEGLRKKSKETTKKPTAKCSKNQKQKTNDTSTPALWDRDGTDTKKSSIRILIDWLTTEGNFSDYMGGLNKHGKTNSNRKESYHNLLAATIKNENGSIRSTESIRNKIVRILHSYNTAQFRLDTTGAGMSGIEYNNFQDEVINKHCLYYNELKPILADRPNVTPWATNFDSDSESDKISNDEDGSESYQSIVKKNHVVIDMLSDCDDESLFSTNKGTVSNIKQTFSNTFSQQSNEMLSSTSTTTNTQRKAISVKTVNTPKVANKRKENPAATISPADAKHCHHSLIRQRKKQITRNDGSVKSKLDSIMEAENEDRNYLRHIRQSKMEFEINKHSENKQMEMNRHNDMKEIEMKKLAMQQNMLEVDQEEKNLKKEHLRAQMEIEKNNLLLVQMQVLEKQNEMRKRNDTEINKKLDNMFKK